MENVESLQDKIPRGGPNYHPDLIGPLTRVPEFEDSVVEELQSLWSELGVDLSQVSGDDLSIDELKIFTEEELVNKALKEVFLDEVQMENPSQVSGQCADEGRNEDSGASSSKHASSVSLEKERGISVSGESVGGSIVENGNGDNSPNLDIDKPKRSGTNKPKKKRGTKRGRAFDRNIRAAELDSGYIAKVEQLAEIKKKQDEDRAAARLHSFNGGHKTNEESEPMFETFRKMKSLRFPAALKVKPCNVDNYVPVSHPEIVLCVEIYNIKTYGLKTQEFLVLGRQTLSELRDKICCRTDQLMQKEKLHDPSGYFLIEDVFCNDLRDPSAVDYSKPILDWLRNSKEEVLRKWEYIHSGECPKLPNFKAVEMNKVSFFDLSFRLGAGYLYCHQGACRHIIVIRDMRLIHPEDIRNRAAYPLLIFQLKTRANKCSVCNIYRATKITVDDKYAPENPCYFCDNCYFLLHYSEARELLYDFTVYDYHPDGELQ